MRKASHCFAANKDKITLTISMVNKINSELKSYVDPFSRKISNFDKFIFKIVFNHHTYYEINISKIIQHSIFIR